MLKRKQDEPMPDFSEIRVKLKPVFGLAPATYLTFIYSVLILTVLFFLLLYPGLRKNGTVISFTSSPSGAAVWIDEEYGGATPCRLFVPRGTHTVRVSRAFFEPATSAEKIRGRIFGSLFSSRKRNMRYRLRVADPEGLLRWTAEDFSAWGMLNQFSHDKQLPRSLSDAVGALADSEGEAALALLENAALFADSPMELKELFRALIAMETGGSPLSSLSLQRIFENLGRFSAENPGFALWLVSAVPARRNLDSRSRSLVAETLTGNDWFQNTITAYLADIDAQGGIDAASEAKEGNLAKREERVEHLRFVFVPGGSFLSGMPVEDADAEYFPYRAAVDGFYMADSEVTNRQFSAFVEANPEWGPDNRNALIAENLAGEGYLADWNDSSPGENGDLPVTGVSHPAAAAYCLWLSGRLPSRLSGYTTRLPKEEEWEWAAIFGGVQMNAVFLGADGLSASAPSRANSLGIRDLRGNVWEWCLDWSFPVKNLLPGVAASGRHIGAEKVVKGGSWANTAAEIQPYTRGSQPPEWCTPYLGFRVVLAVRTDGES